MPWTKGCGLEAGMRAEACKGRMVAGGSGRRDTAKALPRCVVHEKSCRLTNHTLTIILTNLHSQTPNWWPSNIFSRCCCFPSCLIVQSWSGESPGEAAANRMVISGSAMSGAYPHHSFEMCLEEHRLGPDLQCFHNTQH